MTQDNGFRMELEKSFVAGIVIVNDWRLIRERRADRHENYVKEQRIQLYSRVSAAPRRKAAVKLDS